MSYVEEKNLLIVREIALVLIIEERLDGVECLMSKKYLLLVMKLNVDV